nr:hypothetical protein [Lactiplantibacillus plantarum]
MKKLKSFEVLSDEEAKLIIGGGHCYTAGVFGVEISLGIQIAFFRD